MDQRLPAVSGNASQHAEWIAGRIQVLLSHYFQPEISAEVQEAGLDDWAEALLPFSQPAIEHATRTYIRDQPRRRPTPGDIRARAVEAARPKGIDAGPMPKANRNALSPDERDLLEGQILPTARRWVQKFPALAEGAAKTLEHWGEPIPTPNVLPKTREEREAVEVGYTPRRITPVEV